jgi:hypothetical protein
MATYPDEREWPAGWADHRRAQMRRMATLPLSEKIAWLEEAQRVAISLRDGKPRTARLEVARGPARDDTA